MRRILLTHIFLCCYLFTSAQQLWKAVIADSISRQGLAFASIRAPGENNIRIAGIGGRFSLSLSPGKHDIIISHAGYKTKTFNISVPGNGDTLYLSPVIAALGEVIVKPNNEKINRIINKAITSKPMHNPDGYDLYQCDIYYKMKTDLEPQPDTGKAATKKTQTQIDTGFSILNGNSHLIFSEVYSRRQYKRPHQLQETIIASRFSGLRKTYFANLVTDVLPFHIYGDYINLNGKDYINPVSKGWQQRYRFRLVDEIINGVDTIFMFAYSPKKGTAFNGLRGNLYIDSRGYAISHFTGNTSDGTHDREVRIEQVYQLVSGKWFPAELNYDLIFHKYPLPDLGMHMNGRSVIDSVSFVAGNDFKIDKAYPVKLHDSVDLHSDLQWQQFRHDTITTKERNTYRVIDSVMEKVKMEKLMDKFGKFAFGFYPAGKLDIDLKRIIANNDYEGTRLGVGLYTNEKISPYFTAGGWIGYGIKDKVFKYGASTIFYPDKNKDRWIGFSWQRNYQSQGTVYIHRELDRTGLRNWLLGRVDMINEFAVRAHFQKDYWQFEPFAMRQNLDVIHPNGFNYRGIPVTHFKVREAGLSLRYAYAEKRIPVFGYYLPAGTIYPVVYLRASTGRIGSGLYETNYLRLLSGITYHKHINRWGHDYFKAEAGIMHTFNREPLPPSFLLAGNGFRTNGLNFYAWGGFLTFRPYDYYSDRYVSLLYKHDFDKYLWQTKFSKPFIGIAHNLLYGGLSPSSRESNPEIKTPSNGYHETGLLLNQLLQKNFFHAMYLYVNAGVFYHWTPGFNFKQNGVFVIGISAGL